MKTSYVLHDGNPPIVCPQIYDPVSGATGSFGPLATGNWVLRDANNTLQFTVTDGKILFGDFNICLIQRMNLWNFCITAATMASRGLVIS